MSQLTLPGLTRKRRDLRAEAAIPCATGTPTSTATATHLTGDRDREPSFDDLITGNDREPSHADLVTADEPAQQPARKMAYPGVGIDTVAWLRKQDVDDRMAAAAAKAAQWLREHDPANKLAAPAPAAVVDEPPAAAADHDEHAFDVDHLVPVDLCTVDLAQLDTDTDTGTDTGTGTGTDDGEALTVPAGNSRLLFDALDALDRLPGLYAVDAGAFEMAASTAAIQTYLALRPDLLHTTAVAMAMAPVVALLKLVDAEQDAAESPADGAL